MMGGNEKGNYFQQGLSLARNVLQSYTRQDEFLIMSTSDLGLNQNYADQPEALEDLRSNMKIRQNIRPHTDILNFTSEIFGRASNRVQELYFISDFQRTTVLADSQLVNLEDTSVIIKYIPLATRTQNNVYVESQEILSQIIEKGKPINMTMNLVNDGNNVVNELGVRVLLEGKVAAIANKTLEAGTTTAVDLTFTPTDTGWVSGYIELDDYPIEYDNKRFFSLYVPQREKVLVIESETSKNLRILYKDVFSQFDASFVSVRNLSTVQLTDYQALILLGSKEISSGLSEQLRTFLKEGGSIMFFPGSNMKLDNVNGFFTSLGLGSFQKLKQIKDGTKASTVDLDHPIFKGVFSSDAGNNEFDAPQVFQYYPFKSNNNSVQTRIISLDNQDPFLLETQIEKGILYIFSAFPGDAWTDFHVKTSFSPVMFRATQIMSQTQNAQLGQEIGAFEPHPIRSSKQGLIKLVGVDSTELIPEQYDRGGATVLDFEKLDIKEGNYDIVQEDEILEKIGFNVSDKESKLDFLDKDALADRLTKAGYGQIKVIAPEANSIVKTIRREKEGTPLWKYFLILALVFLACEIFILKIKDN